jgi:DNA-binding ferritin-like protein (Dps family)
MNTNADAVIKEIQERSNARNKNEAITRANATVEALPEGWQNTVREIASDSIRRGYISRFDRQIIADIIDDPAEAKFVADVIQGGATERKGGAVYWALLGQG